MSDGYEIDQPPPPSPEPQKPARSVLDDSGNEVCPSCGKALPPGGIVCLECGYDMKEGKRQATWVGKPVEKEPEPEGVKPLGVVRGLKRPALLWIGCGMLVFAAGLAAWGMKPEAGIWYQGLRFVVVLLQAVVHTGTGLAALWAAGKMLGRPLGKLDLAAARMFLAVVVFLLLINLPIVVRLEWLRFMGIVLKVGLAVAGYWVCLFSLFTREGKSTNAIGALHAAVAMLLYMQFNLWMNVNQYME